jgi:hypothetical protein
MVAVPLAGPPVSLITRSAGMAWLRDRPGRRHPAWRDTLIKGRRRADQLPERAELAA